MSLPLPLFIGTVGHYVSLLHHRLRVLGVEVPSAELSEDRFGPGTEAAIRSFQMRNGLSGSGASLAHQWRDPAIVRPHPRARTPRDGRHALARGLRI
jgi:peptidoglycan hydrolase-like protein with peptidoglycan-binding domain